MLIQAVLIIQSFCAPLSFAARPSPTPAPSPTPVVSTGPSLTLSIKDAVLRALNRNPDEATFKERLEEGKSNKSFAIGSLFPVITGTASADIQKDPVSSGSAAFEGDSYNRYLGQLRAIQPIYQDGLLGGLRFANKDIDIRQLDLEVTERALIVSVIQQFYSVFTDKQVYNILRETQGVERESLATADRYYRIGRGQLIDVLQIKTQIAQLNPQIETAENQMKSSASQLATLLHEDQTSTLNLIGSLAVVEPQAVQSLLPNKKKLPEITRGETQISQFKDKIDVSLATYFPTLSVQGTYGQTSNTKSEFFSAYSTGWSVGLYLTVPLFNGLTSIYQRHALNSQAIQLEYAQQKLLDTLSYNETQAERNFDTAYTVLKSAKEASNLAKASLKEAQRDFKLQTINYLQLLTSQQNYLSVTLTYIQAKGSYINTLANYCAALGIPINQLVDILDSKKDAPEEM